MTADELTAKIKDRVRVLKHQLKVLQTISMVLEPWDGRTINKRVGTSVEKELLGQYHVNYFVDKPYWTKISVWMLGDKDRDNRWEFYIHYDNDGKEFNFMKFLERNSTGVIYDQLKKYQDYLDNPMKVEFFLILLEEFRVNMEKFHKEAELFGSIHHLLDDKTRKIITETRFLI